MDVPDQTVELKIEHEPDGKKTRLIAHLPDGGHYIDTINLSSAPKREAFVAKVAERCPGFDAVEIGAKVEQIAASALTRPPPQDPAAEKAPADPAALLETMPPSTRADALDMLKDQMLIQRVVDDIAALGVAGERELAATIYLVGTSRLLRRPLAGLAQGPTASGKSFPIEQIALLFPSESVINAKQMTPQALFHMEPGSLVHKFIVAGERSRLENDDSAEATRALREMLSSQKLSKLMPVKVGNELVTKLIEQDGPIAYIESTTLTKVFDEDANRFIMVQTDERPEQTRRIYRAVAAAYSGERRHDAVNAIIQRHTAAQRMLTTQQVVVPFAGRLAELLPADRVEGRRAIGHLMGAISAVALLHQFQRLRTTGGAVIATAEDYQIAKRLLDGPLSRLLGRRISDAAARFRERLLPRVNAGAFTTREALHGEAASDRAVRGWLNELGDAGWIEQIEPGRGSKPATWRLLPEPADECVVADLPSLDDVFSISMARPSDQAQTPGITGDLSEGAGIAGEVPECWGN